MPQTDNTRSKNTDSKLLNQPAPEAELPATGGKSVSPGALPGKIVVLYFYPKDNTPGCTTEGQNFRDLHAQFVKAGAMIFGVSRDSLKSHENFKAKMGFPFDLLSDVEEEACKAYDVIKMKNMYGKKVRGIERSTFVIDRKGIIRREWRGLKVPGHAQEVLEFVKSLG
ncbi:MAG: peroxiredoxin [Burkholderiales bacterium]|nr:peroxiredoxin [Burkholderiales bacterium]